MIFHLEHSVTLETIKNYLDKYPEEVEKNHDWVDIINLEKEVTKLEIRIDNYDKKMLDLYHNNK